MTAWWWSVVLALQSALGAQPPPTLIELIFGRTVRQIAFTIEDRPATAAQLTALSALVEVKEGDPLRMDAVRSSVSHLSSAGRFDKVDVIGTPVTAGSVDVLFKLEPRHPIDKLAFSGDTGLAAGQLEKLVGEQYGHAIPTGSRLRNADAVVRGVLQGEGYLGATVASATIPTHNPDRATLMFQVSAGPRARITQTRVTGASPFTPDQIRAKTDATTNSPYRSRALDSKLADVRDTLKSRGYYQATARQQPAEISGNGLTAIVTLQVEAGPRIRLEQTGCKLPTGKLEDYVPVQRESSADNDLLYDSSERLKSAFRRAGYWKADASYTRETVGGELVITYALDCGLRYRVDRVDITGNASMAASGVQAALGVKDGDVFNVDRIEAARLVLQSTYRQRGYADANVAIDYEDATTDPNPVEGRIVVKLSVTEGTFAQIAAIRVTGSRLVSELELRALLQSKIGEPYDEATVQRDSDALLTFYRDRGFQTTTPVITVLAATPVEGAPAGGAIRDITLVVEANEGPQIRVAEITIIGNHDVSEQTIRDELTLKVGDPFSESQRFESRRRISDLGSFRRVAIDAEPLRAGETQAHLVVAVDEAPKTTIGYGGGVEADRRAHLVDDVRTDRLDVRPRGFFDIGRRNLWGKNRSINFFTRVSLRPENTGSGYTFNEYQTTATYREHRAFRTDADFLVGAMAEQAVRTGFDFKRSEFNAELLRRLSPQVTVIGRYALDFTHLFNVDPDVLQSDITLVDRLFPDVRLSILSSGLTWDRRDYPLTPSHGTLVSADGEIALRAIGSQVGYAKTLLQGSVFQSLSASKRFVVAGRAQLGVAHPFALTAPDGTPLPANLPASQRFFAGGGTTVRGFQLDRLGVPEILNKDGLSNGGNGLVVLNAELRSVAFYSKGHPISLVVFLDGGNVFANARDLDLGLLRRAAGFGFRGDTPLGSLRLDFGFKLDPRFINGVRERGWEYHLSFGEAF